MSNAPIVNRRFVKKANVVVVKTDVSDTEINSMELINDITQIKSNIDQMRSQLEKVEEQKKGMLGNIEQTEESLRELMKFEKWAMEIQESKIKALVDENFEKCKAQVEAEYKYDDAMTKEQNNITKYQRIQRELGILPEIATTICKVVIHNKLFNNCIFKNPWA